MTDLDQNIRKLFNKHFPTLQAENTMSGNEIKVFIEELGIIVQKLMANSKKQEYSEGAYISIRELEEILRVMRDLKECYENNKPHTTQDILRLDELKQLEYKLTEKVLTNR